MKTSVRAAVEVMFQRRRQCLTAGQVLINRDFTQNALNRDSECNRGLRPSFPLLANARR